MRQPIDYKNGKIYVIRNHINEKVYVGSTTQSLSKRWGEHKGNRESKKSYEYPIYKAMREIGVEHFYIELLENYPCENKEQLRSREGHYIRQFDSYNNGFNGYIAGRDRGEWCIENRDRLLEYRNEYRTENKAKIADIKKGYYEKNKERVKNRTSKYYYENKDKILEHQSEKVVCDCGKEIRRGNVPRHKKSQIHKNNYLSSKINSVKEANIL